MNYSTQINNIETVLKEHDLLEEFRTYIPSETTGYAYATSPLIKKIKKTVSVKDQHSDATFNMCCIALNKKLNSEQKK